MKKLKQIVCIICAALLAGIYIVTLIFSISDSSQAKSWLSASLYATVAVPIVLYAFLLITKQMRNRNPAGSESMPDKPEEKDGQAEPEKESHE
ncbi:hypothetical protein [Qiania dongpingensis]|uniref:Uncharacterized protein n=1 Tax=Qiania dongpingensis TaxID=2763669 RepID=A0A7G9G1Y2_9FIRM|nr:hypothetical protein [Qiania dongpingensis]QNM04814.1 hypothetical protein H9Q78_10175 [Qiania dongpingensis]